MVICGQNFDFSVLNANDLDRFEDAQEKMQARNAAQTERFHRGGSVWATTCVHRPALRWTVSTRSSVRAHPPVWVWMKTTMAPVYDVLEDWATPLLPRNSAIPPEPPSP